MKRELLHLRLSNRSFEPIKVNKQNKGRVLIKKLLPTGGNFFNINPASGKPDAGKNSFKKITPKLEEDTEISVLKA